MIINICEYDWILTKAIANACGAFEVFAILPVPPNISFGPVSVKAWVDTDGDGVYELQASWLLDIVEEQYLLGTWYEWWSYWSGPTLQ